MRGVLEVEENLIGTVKIGRKVFQVKKKSINTHYGWTIKDIFEKEGYILQKGGNHGRRKVRKDTGSGCQ